MACITNQTGNIQYMILSPQNIPELNASGGDTTPPVHIQAVHTRIKGSRNAPMVRNTFFVMAIKVLDLNP
jgi:hypothetical protein